MSPLLAGFIICAAKFIPNILTPGSDLRKDLSLIPEIKRQASEDPRIIDAVKRVLEPGRRAHDLTNLAIEFFRFATATWEQQNTTQIMSGIVKGLSFLILGQAVVIVLLTVLIVLLLLWHIS